MKYLLDTNVCVKFLSGTEPNVAAKFASVPPENKLLCSVVKAELYFGAFKSQRLVENLTTLDLFFNRFVSLDFDDTAARIFGEIRADLSSKGTPIGPYDLQIAAIALSNDATLVTHNTDEFSRVHGLALEDWESP